MMKFPIGLVSGLIKCAETIAEHGGNMSYAINPNATDADSTSRRLLEDASQTDIDTDHHSGRDLLKHQSPSCSPKGSCQGSWARSSIDVSILTDVGSHSHPSITRPKPVVFCGVNYMC